MKVIKHSEEVLKVALISKDTQLVRLYDKFESKEKHLFNEAFQPDSILFKPITLHSDSDWISSHPEPTQDFAQFYHDPCRSIPSPQKSHIYIKPIGSFGDSRVSTDVYMRWLKDYCEAFYSGLTVRILGPEPVSQTNCAFRVNEYTHNLQIHAGHLLKYLKKKKPKDAFCIVGITMIDLYPRDSWNFVFGQASLSEGIGIFSFARYDSDFYSVNYKGKLKATKKLSPTNYSVFDDYYTPEVTSILLLRSCKTLTHEIGHIFGLHHCQWLQCVMQGSNHLEESDRRPLDLCPICLRKLQSALGFNITERYKALKRWMEEESNGTEAELSSEAQLGFQKPVEAFKESYDWIVKCLEVLQK
ncbi:archaemetzincin-2 [Sphaerodactylus townsendi]|uniref:Archaemetzincin-2 n=1 Tax=Sphaerodactylus townsendi TaxID=933632 RepID=A0ACB8EL35_9SAUR|nr:archaemetzincin-2 [Sphaerodactylus townsendi]XP_048347774.1 archaemetzincin-2 [Sphaerodactylus townsendi]XP_048347775.1 archaemetzincin-2 [Sphaerodactylus townsendi]XP_048347776.1 archaemetzincin-2 [Sphaerodactylus townsendi]XP_048347777.1 archaemetzincin-2 [Sphaerodactylus townsendi]XP_048347778.1 archaemetzincin-2 [Sphaerodactylus townsendi]XP_048347781.1 archaemetzincin-2 [Sphaerodactylus townsendi]XP_048347782.1 archaemetzincin-2 [Sphaerodactylus townsendi]XP_048347783.1 archaemetzin